MIQTNIMILEDIPSTYTEVLYLYMCLSVYIYSCMWMVIDGYITR